MTVVAHVLVECRKLINRQLRSRWLGRQKVASKACIGNEGIAIPVLVVRVEVIETCAHAYHTRANITVLELETTRLRLAKICTLTAVGNARQ